MLKIGDLVILETPESYKRAGCSYWGMACEGNIGVVIAEIERLCYKVKLFSSSSDAYDDKFVTVSLFDITHETIRKLS